MTSICPIHGYYNPTPGTTVALCPQCSSGARVPQPISRDWTLGEHERQALLDRATTAEAALEDQGVELTDTRILLARAEAERDKWRDEMWEVYKASGADPDGNEAVHLNPGEGLQAVRELRETYDEALEEIRLDALAKLERVAEARDRLEEATQYGVCRIGAATEVLAILDRALSDRDG